MYFNCLLAISKAGFILYPAKEFFTTSPNTHRDWLSCRRTDFCWTAVYSFIGHSISYFTPLYQEFFIGTKILISIIVIE